MNCKLVLLCALYISATTLPCIADPVSNATVQKHGPAGAQSVVRGSGCYALAPADFDPEHDAAVGANQAGLFIHLAIAGGKTTFHPGERIPVQVTFISKTAGYKACIDAIARNGYFASDDVYFEQADGVMDPAPDYNTERRNGGMTYSGPGPRVVPVPVTASPTATSTLSAAPAPVAEGDLNPWLRFSKAGTYRMYMRTTRFNQGDNSLGPFMAMGPKVFDVASDVLTVTIVADDPAWTAATLAKAKAELAGRTLVSSDDSHQLKGAQTQLSAQQMDALLNNTPEIDGARTLRYLGTPDAIAAVIDHFGSFKLWDEMNSGAFGQSEMAVYEAIDRPAALAELKRSVGDSHFPVRDAVLYVGARLEDLGANSGAPPPANPGFDRSIVNTHEKWLADTAAAVEHKVGAAREVTLYTLLMASEYAKAAHKAGAAVDCAKYAAAMSNDFGDMPIEEVNSLLDLRMGAWTDLASHSPEPLLERIIASQSQTTETRSEAAQRLLEVNAKQGRALVLADIQSAKPTLSLEALDMLPDKTLPGIDLDIAKRLTASSSYDDDVMNSGLIARYGTASILPQMRSYAEPYLGNWACAIQSNMLAYFLRVDPDYGVSAVKKCLASRSNTGCYKMLFTDVGRVYPCEPLRQLAIAAMTDPSVDVSGDAVQFLGKFGDNDALLRARLESVNSSAPKTVAAATTPLYSFNLKDMGNLLVNSIARNPSMLYDHDRLMALKTLCITPGETGAIDSVLQEQGTLSRIDCDAWTGWDFGQYQQLSLDQVEKLAAQCKPGTHLTVESQGFAPPRYASESKQLVDYLAKRGVTASLSDK